MERHGHHRYRPTESQYKGGAEEFYVTYDLRQPTRRGMAIYPKVKRVYIAGSIKAWDIGTFPKKSGRQAHGVRIAYAQRRTGYHRHAFRAMRGRTKYQNDAATVRPTTQLFTHVIDVPSRARHIALYSGRLPKRYREALQDVR